MASELDKPGLNSVSGVFIFNPIVTEQDLA